MHNFGNLNDSEFEFFCKDMMERSLGMKLRKYSRGRDGGIDLNDYSGNNEVIVQVKHYFNSKYSDLKTSLKIELEKVKKLSPKKYYVCVGMSLSPQNINEIYSMFYDYMEDTSHIVTLSEMDDFLEKDENQDILKKNFKLWLSASNILTLVNNKNVFIDCDELIHNIEEESKYFVGTTHLNKAMDILEKENILIVVGGPGVGKTTLSKMLVLKYADNDYSVRYTTDNSVADIKKVLSDKKEIILLDDFLGQHYLKINDSKPNEIKSLLSYVKRSPNKKIILNSRITILNEAKRTNLSFNDYLTHFEKNNVLLDMDKVNLIEKAKIFYNHLFYNNLPILYFENIKKDKWYLDIVKHRNFNPRIIEYATKKRNYKNVTHLNYCKYVLEKLSNPEDVWADEFENRVGTTDRILMLTLYSLTNHLIEISVLENAFNARLKNIANVDTTINQFKLSLSRLNESVIKIVDENGTIKVGVINPSVNDFLRQYLGSNPLEQQGIVENVFYVNQLEKFDYSVTGEIIVLKISNGEFFDLQDMSKNIEYHFLNHSLRLDYYDRRLIDNFWEIIERCINNEAEISTDISMLTKNLIFRYLFSFGDGLEGIKCNIKKFSEIVKRLRFEDFSDVIKIVHSNSVMSEKEKKEMLNQVKEVFLNKYLTYKNEKMDELVNEKLNSYFDSYSYQFIENDPDFSTVLTEITDELIEDTFSEFSKICEEYLLSKLDIDVEEVCDFIGDVLGEDDIREFYSQYCYEPEFDDDWPYGEDEIEEVSNIFER